MVIERFGIYLVALGPTRGAEIKKTRPCVVVSPAEIHHNLRTTIVAPMTTAPKGYPTRVACQFARKRGEVACDQVRAVDQSRLVKRLGRLDGPTATKVAQTLVQMFST